MNGVFCGQAFYICLWSQVEFARQQIRSQPRLAILPVQNMAAPCTKRKLCRRAEFASDVHAAGLEPATCPV